LREETLHNIADTTREEFFDLGSAGLRSIGVDCDYHIDLAIAKVQRHYWDKLNSVGRQYGTASREYRDAKLANDRFRESVFSKVKGGEALIGGLGERILNIPYFTKPNYASVASGPHAAKEQELWELYRKEAMREKPDLDKLEKLHKHFTPYNEDRYQEFMRVNHMMYVAAMARYLRGEMKESYSEYYQGPGNSAYSNAGQKMVSKLSGIIRSLIKQDKDRWGASAFAKDIYGYFDSPHSFAWTALEWYSH